MKGKYHVVVKKKSGARVTRCGHIVGFKEHTPTQLLRSSGIAAYRIPERVVSLKKLMKMPIDEQCLRCVGFR